MGTTPLHYACQLNYLPVAKTLFEAGANPNYMTELGETIFDNWPLWAENDLVNVIRKHNINRIEK